MICGGKGNGFEWHSINMLRVKSSKRGGFIFATKKERK